VLSRLRNRAYPLAHSTRVDEGKFQKQKTKLLD